MAADYELGALRVEQLPDGRHAVRAAVVTRAEARPMPDRQRALVGVGIEVVLEPVVLLVEASRALRAFARQRVDPPRPEVIAIPAPIERTGELAEVAEVALGVGVVVVVVVARDRSGALLELAPCRCIAAGVVAARAVGVNVVAGGERPRGRVGIEN